MLKRIKQALCIHSFDYWGKEELYTSIGDEFRGIATPVYTLICSRCHKQIVIRDRSKRG